MITCYRAIALSFGYVESNTTSWLIYYAEDRFADTRKQAIHSLTEYLYSKYCSLQEELNKFNDLYKGHMAKCCKNAWYKRDIYNPPEKCPKCGASYAMIKKPFSVADWQGWLLEIHGSNCDSYGEHMYADNPYGWNPWMYDFTVPQNQMVIIGENAEHILTEALAELHPELKDEVEDDDYSAFNRSDEEEPYFTKDYINLCDEACVYQEHGYVHEEDLNELVQVEEGVMRLQKAVKRYTETLTIDYPNGSQSTIVDGRYTHILYDTGDQIWLKYEDGKYTVTKVHTHDGLKFDYTSP